MEIKIIETFDDSEVLKQLEAVEKTLEVIADNGDAAGKSISEGMQEGEKAAESLNKVLQTNATQVSNQAKAVEASSKNLQGWRQLISESVNGIQVFGKSIGEWREQLGRADIFLKSSAASTEKLTVAQRILNVVLKANPIGLLITAIAGLLSYFTRFQSGIDLISAGFASVTKVVDVLLDRLALVGSAIVNFAKGDFSAGVNDLKDSVDGLGSSLADAATEAFALERRLQTLRDAQIEASVAFARQEAVLQRLKEAGADETLSYRERTQAIREAGEIEARIASTRLELAKENLSIAQDQIQSEAQKLEALIRGDADAKAIADQRRKAEREARETQTADLERLAEAEIAVVEAQAESDKTRRDLENELREIRKASSEERKRQLEEERKASEAILQGLEKLRVAAQAGGIDREIAETNRKYDDLIQLAETNVAKLKEIEARRSLTPEEIAQLQELGDLQVQIEAQRLQALVDILVEYNEQEIKAEEEQVKRREELTQKERDIELKKLEDRRDLNDELIELARVQGEGVIARLEASGASAKKIDEAQTALDLEIQARKLQNAIDFQTKLLKIETDPARVQQIIAQIKVLQGELSNLDIDRGDKEPVTIFSLLGIDDPDVEGAIRVAVDQVKQALDEIAEARVRDAERRTQEAEKRVQEAQNVFDEEKRLAEEGLASNVTLAKRKLDTQKALREQALKDQQRAQKAQILLQSVEQVSSLVTASASLFKSLAPLPFGIGVPLAIGLIATMFGAFAVSKSRALAAVGDVPKLRTGAKLKGLSHESGGVPLYVQGNAYEAENGEWLIGSDASREHDAFLARLNKGEFKNVDLNTLLSGHRSDYLSPLGEAAPRIVQIERDTMKAETSHNFAAISAAYSKGAAEIIAAIEEKEVIKPWKGGYIEEKKRGNMTTRKRVIPGE